MIEKRIRGRNRRITIGRYPDLTVEQARTRAQKFLAELALGQNPFAAAYTEHKTEVTLERAFADFMAVRKSIDGRQPGPIERRCP